MEIVDVVDDNDVIIGSVPKEELYKKLLTHRIVHVLIFNGKGEMALQMRSANVAFCPKHWSTSVGGHVQSGETCEQAAMREMLEEIGITIPIEYVGKEIYEDSRPLKRFLYIYSANFDGPFNTNPEAVEHMDFFSLDEMERMIASGEKFHPELKFLLEKRFGIKTA